jgi:GT2 family glycosyltransferase
VISVLINSHRPDMAEATRAMYARLLAGRTHEVIVISDARSMCEGYARAMKMAQGDVIVFAHHDLEYLFDDFAAVLDRAMAQFDVIGVAGTDELVHPIWTAAGISRLFGQIVHPGNDGGFDVEVYGTPGPMVGGIVAMDGLFLAARRESAEAIGWDGDLFDGWHLYDIDFTYRAALAGYRLGVVPELGFLHQSNGSASADYPEYARRFAAKHQGTIRFRKLRPMQVAKQHVATLEEAREIMRPAYWRRGGP